MMGTEKAEDRAQPEDGAMTGWSSWRSELRKGGRTPLSVVGKRK